MGRFVLFCLVVIEIWLVQAMARPDGSVGSDPLNVTVRDEVHLLGSGRSFADPPVPSGGDRESSSEGTGEAEAPAGNRRLGKHHSSDKSVAGGGVIIGGLVTAIFAAVYCYIRVTRKRSNGDKQ